MAPGTSSRFRARAPSNRPFLELPYEIRHTVYQFYFADTKSEVKLNVPPTSGFLLPCSSKVNFERLVERMKKNGLTFCDIAQNRTISLLLVSRAFHDDAVISLYENKKFCFRISQVDPSFMPLTPKRIIKHLDLFDDRQLLESLSGYYYCPQGRMKWIPKRYEDSRTSWRKIIVDEMNLQTLKITSCFRDATMPSRP